MNKKKGLFITFEGPEASGKSSQINLLKKYFIKKNIPYLITREPGGTKIAEKLRNIILNKRYNISFLQEILLLMASRSHHLDKKILPIVAPALDTLKIMVKNNKFFDLIFIDSDKGNYINYFNSSLDLINSGSLVIIDNVLWRGDVFNKKKNDKQTNTIREFNSYVKNDKRVEKFIFPLGDGMMLCRKL